MMKPVTHVIFDMDGLLLDTESHYTKAAQMYLDAYGKQFTWEIKSQMMGRKQAEAVALFIKYYDLPVTVEECATKMRENLERLFPTAVLMPGAEKLVRHLHTHHVPMCICTGSSRHNYQLKTGRHREFFGLFGHVVCSPDEPEVVNGKPAPDCFLLGLARFSGGARPAPDKVLVFEDAVNGIQAANNAGMQSVLVPDERMDPAARDMATLCLKSLSEFKPEMFGLPAFDE